MSKTIKDCKTFKIILMIVKRAQKKNVIREDKEITDETAKNLRE